MRIAIIGSGIAGMTAAHLLQQGHDVHVFEADGRPGGHAQHRDGRPPGGPVAADTGFLVYNERTYPLFTRLLADLGVATHPSDMSFSLSDLRCGLEWRGTSLSTVFAQRRNAAPARLPRHAGRRRAIQPVVPPSPRPDAGAGRSGTLADLLADHRWSPGFLDWYLIPLGSAIWSADPETFTQIPARTFVGVLQPPWPAGPGRPAGVAHGDRRIDPLRRGDPRARAPTRAGCTCATPGHEGAAPRPTASSS